MEMHYNQPMKTFKVLCTEYPEIFNVDKSLCKNYFRQYGKVTRMIFKPRQRSIVVEYTNKEDYLNILSGPSDYEGQSFKVEPYKSPTISPAQLEKGQTFGRKKSKEKLVKKHKLVYLAPENLVNKHNVSYVDNNEVNEELLAMGGYSDAKVANALRKSHTARSTAEKSSKYNRVWTKSDILGSSRVSRKETKNEPSSVKQKISPILSKKKPKGAIKMLTNEQLELFKVVKSQATTVDEKYKILDARDKLLRSNIKKSTIKSSPTIGTCPDMCPEKERLLREIQHQVSIYEQEGTSRHSMNHYKAVKQYSRSSADQETPLSHELRPVAVLQMTMIYLLYNIMDLSENDSEINIAEWFHFLWDRTRGIRKDITQQALCCQGSVELVEQCARFHIHCSARLMGEDPSVFDQKINTENLTKCLQTLKYMYQDLNIKGELCSNEAEFRGYIILLNLSDGNFMWEVQELRRDIQKSREIKFALQVYSAFEKRNYVKFFKLIKSTTYLNACILMRYIVQVRVQALESLIRCFTPPKSISFYPVNELTYSLFFDDAESTIDFMANYGIGVNKDSTSFLIERNSYCIPEFPYVLERSKYVESKRDSSVGITVHGKELRPELCMQIQNHEIYNSFDKDGYLVHDEMFNEIEHGIEDKLLDDTPLSREASPERIKTNIFEQKSDSNSNTPNIFIKLKDDKKNIFNVPQNKPSSSSIFESNSQAEFGFIPKKSSNIFYDNSLHAEATQSNIFATSNNFISNKDEIDATNNTSMVKNIFAVNTTHHQSKSSVVDMFSNKFQEPSKSSRNDHQFKQNIFASVPFNVNYSSMDEQMDSRTSSSEDSRSLLFAQSDIPTTSTFAPKIGGFKFDLDEPAIILADNSAFEQQKALDYKKEKVRAEEEEQQRRLKEEIIRKTEEAELKRLEIEKLKQEETEKKRIAEIKRIEQENRLKEELRRKEEEIKRKLELERQLKAQEKKRVKEIEKTVKSMLNKMIETIDLKSRHETLKRIRENIKRRLLLRICKKWRNITVKRMNKRKALDCHPVFVHAKSVTDCAKDLQMISQVLTLDNIKRYRQGKSFFRAPSEKAPIQQLNLFHLTYSSLRRRLCELKEKWHQHIYWKVVISIPDVNEMITGLHKLEENLKAFINWKLNNYGSKVYIETHKTVTFCVEQQQGYEVKNYDANAFIFIGKSFNDIIQRRIFENLQGFGVFVKIPVIVILEDTSNCEEYFNSLQNTGVISDYLIFRCNKLLSQSLIIPLIENGLISLAKKVEKYPPLEMDTLYDCLKKLLCTEIWKKAASYSKWNHEYHFCMRDPNIVINLYNEALDLITKIVTDKSSKEFAVFPNVFQEYLPNKRPEFLPCDYRYFPNFWTTKTYEEHLKSILNKMRLPKFMENWPPNNESELSDIIYKFCKEIFDSTTNTHRSLVNILKYNRTDENYETVTWIETIQIIAHEKIKELEFKLPKSIIWDVLDTTIVVYNIDLLNEYNASDWFYRNNPIIESYKKIISNRLPTLNSSNTINRKRCLDMSVYREEIDDVIQRAEKVLKSNNKNPCLESKNQIELLHRSMDDLEDSIKIVKKINEAQIKILL